MRQEDFNMETATPVSSAVLSGLTSLAFLKAKSRPAEDVKIPAALLSDDFFSGF